MGPEMTNEQGGNCRSLVKGCSGRQYIRVTSLYRRFEGYYRAVAGRAVEQKKTITDSDFGTEESSDYAEDNL